jgi:nitrite reductase/ring-hydroxylating ferredoxin subunit
VERLVFDPTTVVDGFELTDDPILHARSAAYSVSFARRSGRTAPRPAADLGAAATVAGGAAVAPGTIAAFDVDGARVAVANVDGSLHAISDTCTHRQCSLAEGTLEGRVVTCPCHGSQFDVTSGAVLRGPAREPVRSYAATPAGEDLRLEA